MKKDGQEEWKYLSYYWRREASVKLNFSLDKPRYFTDLSIANGTAWKAFDAVVRTYPSSKVVLYVEINNEIMRVKYYNPNGEKRVTTWLDKDDFYSYIPQREL